MEKWGVEIACQFNFHRLTAIKFNNDRSKWKLSKFIRCDKRPCCSLNRSAFCGLLWLITFGFVFFFIKKLNIATTLWEIFTRVLVIRSDENLCVAVSFNGFRRLFAIFWFKLRIGLNGKFIQNVSGTRNGYHGIKFWNWWQVSKLIQNEIAVARKFLAWIGVGFIHQSLIQLRNAKVGKHISFFLIVRNDDVEHGWLVSKTWKVYVA